MTPHSEDAEKGFLSSALHNISILDIHADALKESLFHNPANRIVYRGLVALWKEGSAVDLITLTNHLTNAGLIDSIGGPGYIGEIYAFLPTGHNHEEYLRILREKHTARLAISAAERIVDAANNPAMGGDLSEMVQKALVAVAADAETSTRIESIGEATLRRLNEYEEIFKNKGKLMGLTTGIATMDNISGGMKPGQLLVLGAPTKGGKTALALNIAMRTAEAGNPVGIFSLEMSSGELVDRLVASYAGVDISVLSKDPSKQDKDRITFGIGQVGRLPIWVRDESQINPLQLRAAARRMYATHGVKLLIVDYIQLVEATDRKDSRERQVAEISRTLKQLAKELQVSVLALTQLNAEGSSRESRAIEHDCDSFWVIRPEMEERTKGKEKYQVPTGNYFLDIRLARAHGRGSIPLRFLPEYLRFDEVEQQPN